jgi:hypothetical protein
VLLHKLSQYFCKFHIVLKCGYWRDSGKGLERRFVKSVDPGEIGVRADYKGQRLMCLDLLMFSEFQVPSIGERHTRRASRCGSSVRVYSASASSFSGASGGRPNRVKSRKVTEK